MSEDFKVGDVVVCIDDSPCKVDPFPGFPFGIKRGSTHRVTDLDLVGYDIFLGLLGYDEDYFFAARFRKLPPADDAFILRMRSLKPGRVREREDA